MKKKRHNNEKPTTRRTAQYWMPSFHGFSLSFFVCELQNKKRGVLLLLICWGILLKLMRVNTFNTEKSRRSRQEKKMQHRNWEALKKSRKEEKKAKLAVLGLLQCVPFFCTLLAPLLDKNETPNATFPSFVPFLYIYSVFFLHFPAIHHFHNQLTLLHTLSFFFQLNKIICRYSFYTSLLLSCFFFSNNLSLYIKNYYSFFFFFRCVYLFVLSRSLCLPSPLSLILSIRALLHSSSFCSLCAPVLLASALLLSCGRVNSSFSFFFLLSVFFLFFLLFFLCVCEFAVSLSAAAWSVSTTLYSPIIQSATKLKIDRISSYGLLSRSAKPIYQKKR